MDTGRTETTEESAPRLLLVDDEREMLGVLGEILSEYGYAVVSTWDPEDAPDIATLFKPDVLVTDYGLPETDGVAVAQKVREASPRTRAILMSGRLSREERRSAAREKVDSIVEKPLSIPRLLREIAPKPQKA
jgi:DNA-binding response OmpR family regulator